MPVPSSAAQRRLALCVLAALLAAACGRPGLDRLALGGDPSASPAPSAAPTAIPQPTPPPPPPESLLTVSGDVVLEQTAADVVAEPAPAAPGPGQRLQIEVRHRERNSSQPTSVLSFFNVPPKPGKYPLHAPEVPPVAGRVYAYFTTRGEALGSMTDFNTLVAGELQLTGVEGDELVGTFRVSAQEAPPPVLPVPEGEPVPKPSVGTVPPAPPKHIDALGSFRAPLPPALAASPSPSPAAERSGG